MIKYLGSKRTLVPVLASMITAVEARSAVDLFTGTTRVAQELKRRGVQVTATDLATYSEILGQCYISTDAARVDAAALGEVITELNAIPGRPGYFTETFCEASRFFHPKNGARVDAIRVHLETEYRDSPLFPILLTSLMLAADRVDSTTGVQMAYLKQWAPRALQELELRPPELIAGEGTTMRGDASELIGRLDPTDVMYLDPPYNQHRYFTNYHVWETLVRWDSPQHYGVACKRTDSRDETTKSAFNLKRQMPSALREVILGAKADVLLLSYNDESWVEPEVLAGMLSDAGHETVRMLAFDSKRYVGAQIGIFNPAGEKVGKVARLRNQELVFVAGPRERVEAAVAAAQLTRSPAPTSF